MHPTAVCIPPRCALSPGVRLRGVHHPAKSDSAVCIIPWSQTLQCASHRGVRLHGVHPTAESDFAVCIPPRSQALRCAFAVCMTPRSQHFRLSKSNNVLQIFSFMIDVFAFKRISPACPFKSNQRLAKISILTPQCDAHRGAGLRSGKVTAKLDSVVGCTPRSFLRNFYYLTPWCAMCIPPPSLLTA